MIDVAAGKHHALLAGAIVFVVGKKVPARKMTRRRRASAVTTFPGGLPLRSHLPSSSSPLRANRFPMGASAQEPPGDHDCDQDRSQRARRDDTG